MSQKKNNSKGLLAKNQTDQKQNPVKTGDGQTGPKELKRYDIPSHPKSPLTKEEINRFIFRPRYGEVVSIGDEEVKKEES